MLGAAHLNLFLGLSRTSLFVLHSTCVEMLGAAHLNLFLGLSRTSLFVLHSTCVEIG